MSDLYDNISNLCSSAGISVGKLCSEISVSRGNLSDLKMGRIKSLSSEKLQKIADYFGVSVDYLLTGEDQKEKPTLTAKDERDIARDLEQIMADLDEGGDLMFDGNPMSDEARESIKAAMKLGLQAAKMKNKERFTPKKYRKE